MDDKILNWFGDSEFNQGEYTESKIKDSSITDFEEKTAHFFSKRTTARPCSLQNLERKNEKANCIKRSDSRKSKDRRLKKKE